MALPLMASGCAADPAWRRVPWMQAEGRIIEPEPAGQCIALVCSAGRDFQQPGDWIVHRKNFRGTGSDREVSRYAPACLAAALLERYFMIDGRAGSLPFFRARTWHRVLHAVRRCGVPDACGRSIPNTQHERGKHEEGRGTNEGGLRPVDPEREACCWHDRTTPVNRRRNRGGSWILTITIITCKQNSFSFAWNSAYFRPVVGHTSVH